MTIVHFLDKEIRKNREAWENILNDLQKEISNKFSRWFYEFN